MKDCVSSVNCPKQQLVKTLFVFTSAMLNSLSIEGEYFDRCWCENEGKSDCKRKRNEWMNENELMYSVWLTKE